MTAHIIPKSLLLASLTLTTACQAQGTLPLQSIAPQSLVQTQSAQAESPPVRLTIKRAEIAVSATELNKQFQSILTLSNEKRLKNAVLTPVPGGKLMSKGRVKAKSYLPEVSFELEGSLQALPGNRIRFSPEKIKVAGIPVKSLMDAIGLELSNIAKFKDSFGRIEQKGNDIDLIVQRFTKDAIIDGQIKHIQTTPQELVVIF